jgi:hypothetical protein
MLTETLIANMADMAGPEFTWEGVRGSSRPPSAVKRGLAQYMDAIVQGCCFYCGETEGSPIDNGLEFCHIVSRGPGKSDSGKGWIPGNIGRGHKSCNLIMEARGPVVPLSDIARPDLIPMEWLPAKELRMLGQHCY